jgi:integrase
MPKTEPEKITEPMRTAALRRVDSKLQPSVLKDAEVAGFALHVTSRRAFWAFSYQPRGVNPSTGKRWGGGVRHELGDAMIMTVDQARTAAIKAKGLVRDGKSPHHDAMTLRAKAEASRSILPTTVAEALDAYAAALAVRTTPSPWTRSQAVRYSRKAVRLMKAEALALGALDANMVRLMAETMPGSQAERRHTFGAVSRFLKWCRKQRLVERNVCDDLDADERPKPGRARDHVPTLKTLRDIWAVVEDEPVHVRDLIRFMLLTPLRRDEASELPWGEVDFERQRLIISGERMKNDEMHELPLPEATLALLSSRRPANARSSEFVFPTAAGSAHTGWGRLLTRIREKIGEANASKDQRFRLHDIRRAFVSHLADAFDIDALDQVLAHKRTGVRAVYQRAARMETRAKALAAWAALLLDEVEPDSNIVSFARAAHV